MKKWILAVVLISVLSNCGSSEEEAEKPKKRLTTVVGEVTSVYPEKGFLLFRRYGPGELLSDGLLSARSLNGKRATNLTLSPEKQGRFYTADFSAEAQQPRVGDVVILSKVPDDTKADTFSAEKTPTEELEFKKMDSSPEPEILDFTASQRSE